MATHRVNLLADRVVKTFLSNDRGELEREWTALRLLSEHCPDLAPIPLRRSADSITMTRLPGRPIDPTQESERVAMAAAFRRLWSSVPASVVASLPPARSSPQLLAPRIGNTFTPELARAVERHATAALARDCPNPVLGASDLNLDNLLLHEGVARLVDFEDSGASCPTVELAALWEHVRSRGVPDLTWAEFVPPLLDGCAPTLLSIRVLQAALWAVVLAERDRADELKKQLRRLEQLLALS